MAEKLANEKIKLKSIQVLPLPKEKASLRESLRVVRLLERRYGVEIKGTIKRAMVTLQKMQGKGLDWIWIRPLTLISIFHVISPSFSRLMDFSFIEEDMQDIIEKLQPLSFKVSIRNEVHDTLIYLQDIILPELEKYKVFSSLTSAEQKRKVLFYLLLRHLSEIVKGMIRN